MAKQAKVDLQQYIDILFDSKNRDIQYNDPYGKDYANFEIDHRKLTTGYEYPNIDDPREQEIWNKVVNNANCYAYAFGVKDKETFFPQPGHFGIPDMKDYHRHDREFTCLTVAWCGSLNK